MKYQLIRHFKTVSRVLTVYDSLQDCIDFAKQDSVFYTDTNFIGGFPILGDTRGWVYSIQGLAENFNVVCSIPKEEVELIKAAAIKERVIND